MSTRRISLWTNVCRLLRCLRKQAESLCDIIMFTFSWVPAPYASTILVVESTRIVGLSGETGDIGSSMCGIYDTSVTSRAWVSLTRSHSTVIAVSRLVTKLPVCDVKLPGVKSTYPVAPVIVKT